MPQYINEEAIAKAGLTFLIEGTQLKLMRTVLTNATSLSPLPLTTSIKDIVLDSSAQEIAERAILAKYGTVLAANYEIVPINSGLGFAVEGKLVKLYIGQLIPWPQWLDTSWLKDRYSGGAFFPFGTIRP